MAYTKKYTVLSSQVDITHHLSNGSYYDLFKSALFSFFETSGFKRIVSPLNLWPIVFNESCYFYHEIFFDEDVLIKISFNDFSEKGHKYTCYGVMKRAANQDVAAKWISHHGILNKEIRKIEPLPNQAIALLKQHLWIA